MIVCPKCSKENQDHYKFCLGCGSDLPRAEAPSSATPPAGIAAAEPVAPASAADTGQANVSANANMATTPSPPPTEDLTPAAVDPSPARASAPVNTGSACANCGANIPPGFAFCGACGTPIGGAAPAPQSSAPVSSGQPASLILIQPDGSEGGIVEIPDTDVAVGRDAGGFFETDAYLSPRHAVFRAQGAQIVCRDEGSLNGVFKKIMPNEPVEIKSGNVFRMGQELILFEAIDKGANGPDGTKRMGSPIEGLWGRISLIVGKGRLGNAFPIGGEGVICGRERGNILFPEDGYISGVHMRIHSESGKFFLTDLGSSNGSYLKLTGETSLNNGDFILMGAQLFRIQT
ncbi:MAG: FHA domain-containing protein [Deltaproteobacteria bacterium]|nr:FHA domain-containing protein [Deltaproteobacteria bacterium]MBN2672536.1 FHA domain-containing protein [Deltaproteobacteria bacterium]